MLFTVNISGSIICAVNLINVDKIFKHISTILLAILSILPNQYREIQ